jgi:hypothetical protein
MTDEKRKETDDEAVRVITEIMEGNSYTVVDRNKDRTNNPVFDLECTKGPHTCFIDAKGQRKEGSVWGRLKPAMLGLFVVYVLPVFTPRVATYVLAQSRYNGLVQRYWDDHPTWAQNNDPNGFEWSGLKPLAGGWEQLPGWDAALAARRRGK